MPSIRSKTRVVVVDGTRVEEFDFESRAKTRFSNEANLAEMVSHADLVIGAVLVLGVAAAASLLASDESSSGAPARKLLAEDPTFELDRFSHGAKDYKPRPTRARV